MLPQELAKKVRRIEITTHKLVNDMLSGRYRTRFKGQGMQFSEHRVYQVGDDVRHIDWKVSARSKELLLKKYEEERELTVFLVVDISASEDFGTENKLKSEMAAEVGGLLAYAANRTGDKAGALLFAGEVEKIIPPKKGKQHVLRLIRELLSHPAPHHPGTNLARALEAANRIMKHSGVVFVISDFMSSHYEIALKRLARKHDVIAISLADERERQLPELGMVQFLDPETGVESIVNTQSYSFQKWFREFGMEQDALFQEALKSSGVESLTLKTKEDYAEAVARFFYARARRRR